MYDVGDSVALPNKMRNIEVFFRVLTCPWEDVSCGNSYRLGTRRKPCASSYTLTLLSGPSLSLIHKVASLSFDIARVSGDVLS
jgi:hypothetical protein